MEYQLLQRFKLGPGGDVVPATVEFTNLIVFDMISLDVIPVLDGEGVGPCHRHNTTVKSRTDRRLEDTILINEFISTHMLV